MKSCPFCAEEIQDAAIVCKHCGRELTPHARPYAAMVAPPVTPSRGVAAVLSLVIPGAGQMYLGHAGAGIAWLLAVLVLYITTIVGGLILHLVCVLNAAGSLPTRASASLAAGTKAGCPACGKTVVVGESPTCRHCQAVLPWPSQATGRMSGAD